MGRIVIIGGGAIGLSTAYHLAEAGAQDIVLLERNQLTSGTSWHAAGIVGPLRATPAMTQIASYALELFPKLARQTGQETGYQRTGGYWLARHPERLDELNRIADLGATQGLTPRMVPLAEVAVPQLDLGSHAGALYVPEDAQVNPVDLCMAYARAAKSNNVEIRENCAVKRLVRDGSKISGVECANGEVLEAETVVLAAGAWSRVLAEEVGFALPLQAVEHMYVVTQPIVGLPDPFPVIRDLDRGIYIKGDAGKLVIGGFEPNAKCWDPLGPEGNRAFLELAEDWEQFAPFMEAALDLMPSLETAGIQHFMNGPESFTNDTRPLVGPAPDIDGLYVAAGMNSVGVMSSAGIGRALAAWILDGHPPLDAWEIDVTRADPLTATPTHMEARMTEAVADLFAMHWPYKQPKAGRDLRRSALHENWAAEGAHFGLTAGWERGLWYATTPEERNLPYTTAAQHWWPIAEREASAMATGAAILDLTPFTKIMVQGPDALTSLNAQTTANLDVAPGRAVYTQVLNARGGIEMDVTVIRRDQNTFHITSGAATRTRDLAYLRRHLHGQVHIEDQTEDRVILGFMGGKSRDWLGSIAPDLPDLPFAGAGTATIAGVSCDIVRISFVGELGYEISVSNAEADQVFKALRATGARPMGHFALDGCRVEKGFKHWGHDLAPSITPLEAGLGFTIDWRKDFTGKAALLAQRERGLTRKLMLLEVEGQPLMLHDEPVFEAGAMVGLTTSGARGPRTGRTLALALIDIAPGETAEASQARQLSVRVAGEDYRATVLPGAAFDPKGERMRA